MAIYSRRPKQKASERFEERMLRARERASVSKLLASEEDGDSENGKPKRVYGSVKDCDRGKEGKVGCGGGEPATFGL